MLMLQPTGQQPLAMDQQAAGPAAAAGEEHVRAACGYELGRGRGLLRRAEAGAHLAAELAAPSGKLLLSF